MVEANTDRDGDAIEGDADPGTVDGEAFGSEAQLIAVAQKAVSQCNWVVGECAAAWTERYAAGRTDAAFAAQVGLSPDQVYQRRRVWETFGDVRAEYPNLKWSHFYVSLNWPDSAECLDWSEENQATVQEMKIWRRALRGEDIDAEIAENEPPDDWGGPVLVASGSAAMPAGEAVATPPFEPTGMVSAGESVTAAAAAEPSTAAAEYSPFRGDAQQQPEKKPQAEETDSGPSANQVLKRIVVTLEKINRELTEERLAAMRSLPEKTQVRILEATGQLSDKIARAIG